MKKSERYAGIFLILCGIAIAFYGYYCLKLGEIIAPDAGFMPFIVGVALAILSAVWLFSARKAPPSDEKFLTKLWYKPLIALGLMTVYAWSMNQIGYVTSTLLFLLVWMIVIERENWKTILLTSTLGTTAMYTLFGVFLKIPIPKEFFIR